MYLDAITWTLDHHITDISSLIISPSRHQLSRLKMIQVLAAWTFCLVLETRCIQCYVYGLPCRSMLLGLLFALLIVTPMASPNSISQTWPNLTIDIVSLLFLSMRVHNSHCTAQSIQLFTNAPKFEQNRCQYEVKYKNSSQTALSDHWSKILGV